MTSHAIVERLVDVRDGQLAACSRAGDGPALVFLHYWGGSRRTWTPVIEQLDPRQAFLAYDQRGWGNSAEVPGPYDMTQLADDAQQVIDILGGGDYVLVGHSMGGKVAQLLAARKPAGLTGVVLVAPAPPAPVGQTAALQELTSHAYDSEATVRQSIEVMLTNGGLSAALRGQVVEDSLRAHRDARLAWPLHGLVEDVSAGVGGIEVPVLVLAGRHDKVEPPAVLADHLLPLIPTATLVILESTGHLSPLEVPDQLAAQIAAFTAALPGRPAPPERPTRA
ncbi:alpha/beta fold hydrolase [Mycolicibacterium sphagni]|uniref:alpha/beta fold hydrolase n=1 Tax=Mycolicibacterium sphagni TaxID=1786 RepID=UPI0021F2E4CA|nr:alpha/beta hydrolase [Mycolicibacterium sphagni]MCV7179637.1 alpha/beta fold hydrolase [Mycolicibacterium sphagni]